VDLLHALPAVARVELVGLTLDDVEGGTRLTVVEVSLAALARGDATLAPAGTPSPWTPRMAALTSCLAGACS
jgi:hypothetical protein